MIRTIALSLCTLCVLALASTPALAGTLHRCQGTDGTVVYQDRPCSADLHETGTLPFTPEPVRAQPAARPSAAASPRHGRARGKGGGNTLSRSSAALHGIRLETDACRKARAQRDDWERRVGLRRTFDDLRRWQERVDRACH